MDKPDRELRILMLEDVPTDAELEEMELRDAGLAYTLLRVDTREAFVQALDEFKPDIVLADYKLPDYSGRDALEYVRRTHPQIPVIMVTGVLGDEAAVELLKLGARDYVLKDHLPRLMPAIERALSEERGIRNRKLAEKNLRESEEKFRLLSDSAQDAIIMMDADGKISFWNKAAEKIFGYSGEEALGQEMLGLLAPPSRYAAYERWFKHFSARGKVFVPGKVWELAALRKGGIEFPVEISISGVQLGGKWHSIGIVRDITERKQAEMALQVNEKRLQMAIRTGHMGVWDLDLIDHTAYRSLEHDRIFGYESLLPKWTFEIFLDHVLPEDRSEVNRIFNEAVAKQTDWTFECRIRRVDGEVRWIWANGSHQRDMKGVMRRMIGIVQDITERKQAEEKLREARDYLENLFNHANAPIIVWSPSYQITMFNHAFEHLTGRDADEVIGKQIDILFPAERKEEALSYIYQTRTGERWETVEIPIQHASGSVRTALWNSATLYSADGKTVVATMAQGQDITERKQAEVALLHANRALKTLSAGNLALVRSESEDELLREVTRIIVEQGGYCLAEVDYADDNPEKSITPIAWSGMKESQYWAQDLSWADTERGQLPVSRAIRSGTTQICHDIASDPAFNPWRDAALARGYVSNIALPLSSGGRSFGGLSIYLSEAAALDNEEIRLLEELASDLAYGIDTLRTRAERDRAMMENSRYLEKLRQNLEDAIQAIAATVEMRDPTTAGHEKHVAKLSVAIGQELGLAKDQLDGLRIAASVFDVGKVRIPAEILNRPGALDKLTFSMIKLHPETGYEILKGIDFPWPVATIVRQHHERLDGSGYPKGLKGSEILLEAQILGAADVVESMMSHRPYRASLGMDAALKELMDNRGKLYNADVVDACIKLFREKGFNFS